MLHISILTGLPVILGVDSLKCVFLPKKTKYLQKVDDSRQRFLRQGREIVWAEEDGI